MSWIDFIGIVGFFVGAISAFLLVVGFIVFLVTDSEWVWEAGRWLVAACLTGALMFIMCDVASFQEYRKFKEECLKDRKEYECYP